MTKATKSLTVTTLNEEQLTAIKNDLALFSLHRKNDASFHVQRKNALSLLESAIALALGQHTTSIH